MVATVLQQKMNPQEHYFQKFISRNLPDITAL